MCGILGSFHPTRPAPRLSLDVIRHRGPDSRGEWVSPDGRTWLGHTRLAIVDLSEAGAQPMIDPVAGHALSYNGEIYNHAEVRASLAAANGPWRGHSDTETLLVAYRELGRGALAKMRGMFAFLLHDAKRGVLLAARDRLGIKPLYWMRHEGGFLFSSEVRPLLPHVKSVCSPETVSAYLAWGACPEGALLPPGIHLLPAGAWMEIDAAGVVTEGRYWPPGKIVSKPAADAAKNVRKLLERSVGEHLLADVPVAAFLSGGIDSTIVASLAAKALGPGKLHTFSVGFPGRGALDETEIAGRLAGRIGATHTRVPVDEDECLSLVREAVGAMDLPSVDAINTYIVAKKAAQCGHRIALSGLGADELFGGYPSFRDTPKLMRLARAPRPLRRVLALLGRRGRRLAEVPEGDSAMLAAWRRRFFMDGDAREAGLPEIATTVEAAPDGLDDFGLVSWAELSGYMRRMLLRDSDQMSMAVSLEIRVPFLDHELVEYALGLPAGAKTGFAWPKGLLIRACEDLLPREVYDRPKMGFSLPMAAWLRGPLAGFAKEGLDRLRERGLVREQAMDRIRAEFGEGKLHWSRMWELVVLGYWLEISGAQRRLSQAN